MMGSGVGAAGEAVDALVAAGERVGLLTVRLYRPFPAAALLAALPPSVTRLGVLDRTKEPGSVGEPLYLDLVAALAEAHGAGLREGLPRVIGARYGLGSKEFAPAHVKGLLDELAADHPRPHVTVGIVDDVTHTSVDPDPAFHVPTGTVQAVFHGLGSDGTVGSTKATVKILGEHTDLYAQGYFVYDSRKAGAVTESHLRFGPDPIASTYLIDDADFVSVSQFAFLERRDVLARARPGATVLVNSPYGPDEVWGHLPVEVQQEVIDQGLVLHVVDADRVAREAGMDGRINAVMQPCFFALSGVLEPELALAAIRAQIERTYAKAGPAVIERNLAAVDAGARRAGARAHSRCGDRRIRSTAGGPRHGAGLRRARHRPAAGRRGRPVAGQRPARRRCLPHEHRPLGEAGAGVRAAHLGAVAVHRLR